MRNSRRVFLEAAAAAAAGTATTIAAAAGRAAGTKKYRAAVIGRTGRGNYGHGLDVVYNEFDNIQVVAVADENAAGGKKAAERTGAEATYESYEKMLRDEKPDLVSVAPRWADCHHDMVLAAAEAGAHIFLEKPMARTLQEADAMVAACEKRGLKMTIAHQMRVAPVITETKRLLGAGAIGQLMEMRARGKEDRRAGGEDLMVLGTHAMDLMRLLAGDAHWVQAEVAVDGRELQPRDVRDGAEGLGLLAGDTITATYGFDNNVHGFFATKKNAHGSGGRYGVDLYGSKGVITIRAGLDPTVYLFASPPWAPTKDARTWKRIEPPAAAKPAGSPNARMVADLIDAIENNRQPYSSARDGRAALEMILSVYEAQRTRARVYLPMTDRRHPLEAMRA